MERQVNRPSGEYFKVSLQNRIQEITSRQLSPETIDHYADNALEDLVAVVQDTVESYRMQPIVSAETNRELEQAAFTYYGLDAKSIESTLDRIIEVGDSVDRLDDLIAKKTRVIDRVIVPPDFDEPIEVRDNDGSFEMPKEKIPKVKTLLLLLEKSFGIDIENNEDVRITSGVVSPDMMRSTSYNLVEIPQLNRIVLVCDETGNATFVFDSSICNEFNITIEDISALSKNKIKELLGYENRLGRNINYSIRYAVRLAGALGESFEQAERVQIEPGVSEVEILAPPAPIAPAGAMTRADFARKHHLQSPQVNEWINAVYGSVDALKKYRFTYEGRRVTERPGLTVEDQARVLQFAREEQGYIDYRPEGFLSAKGISNLSRVDRESVERIITLLIEEGQLESPRIYRFGSITTKGYSPEDVEMIMTKLEDDGFYNHPPENYLTINKLSKKLGVAPSTVINLTSRMAEDLGEIEKFRAGPNKNVDHYSPEQQDIMRRWIVNNHRKPTRRTNSSGSASRTSSI
jgi:hypothetical protein